MIPEAVFSDFPAKIPKETHVSGRNPPGSARNSTQESGHRNTASMKSPEYHGTGRFLPCVFDLGIVFKAWSDL